MKLKYFPAVAIILIALTLVSWGVTGHRSIAKIAENHLSAKAKIAVKDILGDEEFPLVSTFADEIRYDSKFSSTGKWHYVNLPLGLNYDDFVNYVKEDNSLNVYKALMFNIKNLQSTTSTPEEKAFALKMVIHLVGDLHQPMHVSQAEDLGGNKIKLKFQGKETNLHSLWDSGLIEYNGFTFTEMATALDNVSAAKVKEWQSDDVFKWLYESYQISSQLYTEVKDGQELDYTYYPIHAEIYKLRVQQAGIRLAGLLNSFYP